VRTCIRQLLAIVGLTGWAGVALAVEPDSGARVRLGAAAQFQSSASDRTPLEIATAWAGAARGSNGRSDWEHRVEEHYVTSRTGVTHIRLRQWIGGIRVWNGDYAIHIDRYGRVVAAHDRLPGGGQARNASAPRIGAVDAARYAARALGLDARAVISSAPTDASGGPARRLMAAGISRDPIPAQLVYWRDPADDLWLAWNLVIRTDQDWWEINVDATTGDTLTRTNYVAHDSYRVFAFPSRNPKDADDSLAFDPADPDASPFAWHDTNGVPGAESLLTRGNNAQASVLGSGFQPSGGPTLDFDFAPVLTQLTDSAPTTNVFYWVNWLHDLHYHYGFDEASGNFQQNNYGAGGAASDSVRIEIQDPLVRENASFGTPADGSAPRMAMGVFTNDPTSVTIEMPAELAQTLEATPADFGAPIGTSGPMGDVVAALDPVEQGAGFTNTDACSTISNPAEVAGRMALIDRGVCTFVVKVANAQSAGAIGVIIANHVAGAPVVMAGEDPSIVIASAMVSRLDGALIRANLGSGVVATLRAEAVADRDSSYDNEVVIHEFGHGISTRLTGGSASSSCLDAQQSEAMGEGWSDFWAIALLTDASHAPGDPRSIASFSLAQPLTGSGFRNFPYSTDLAINPLSYADIESTNQPHGAGEVWAAALWDLYWNLVEIHGFDPDVRFGSGGNNTALELVMDALKLQPCNPDFLDGRDALLQADLAANASENTCAIWDAFAKRGMGVDASSPGAASLAVTEGFAVPAICVPEPGVGLARTFVVVALFALRRRGRSKPDFTCSFEPLPVVCSSDTLPACALR